MKKWYIGGHDGGFADMAFVLGPFHSAGLAAEQLSRVLEQSNGPPASVFSGRDLSAKIGDFFAMEVCDPMSCLMGPYKTKEAARDGIAEELTAGGTFQTYDSQFVGIVRYLRQENKKSPQVLILERIFEPAVRVKKRNQEWMPA